MDEKSVINEKSQVVQVSGDGKTKAAAMAAALGEIHKQIIHNDRDVTVRIEPTSIQVIGARAESYTERFLFIFLPRKRTTYYVDLQVTVMIKQVDVEQIDFAEKAIPSPDHLTLPRIHKLRGDS